MQDASFSKILKVIPDEHIAAAFWEFDSLECKLIMLRELLREAESVLDIETFNNELSDVVQIFFNTLECLIPEDGRLNVLRELVLPYLKLELVEAKAEPAREWLWPEVAKAPGIGESPEIFRPFSALKLFGYTVGRAARDEGWNRERRQRFLSDFIEMELPASVKLHFGGEYGPPLSTTRLKKVANVIASNCGLRVRNNPTRYKTAISDWEDDLAFLKRKYYEGLGLKFQPWPDPIVN